MKSKLILLTALVLMAFSVIADTNEIHLLAEAHVDGNGIYLDQVASGPGVTHLLLEKSPLATQPATFTRRQIVELVTLRGGELTSTNWTGTNQIKVMRRTRQLADFELVQMLTASLQKDYAKEKGELELRLSRPVPATVVPDESLTLKVLDLPSTGLAPTFLARCEVWCGNERVAQCDLNLQAAIWREVPVARSSVTRGTLLKDADLVLERRDVLARRDYYVNYPTQDYTLELTDTLQPGMPLLSHSVRFRPLIQRGHIVDGVFQEGSLTISLKVETLEDGTLGQLVRVRNPKTKRELYGKVQNEETVAISL